MGNMTENFDRAEFACKCGCGFDNINPLLVTRLQYARRLFGKSIAITSGCRCKKHNAAVGGEQNSSHLKGLAADIACSASPTRMFLLSALLTCAIPRIGIGANFIHVDIDLSLPQDVCWIYPAGRNQW